MDAAEAEQRSQILILSSIEVSEAQHRVKLLSFLLFIISSTKLITLVIKVQLWRTSYYCDLFMSVFGFYVATLGIKAANENTSASVHKYLKCLALCEIAWNSYSYYMNVTAQRESSIKMGAANDDPPRHLNYPSSSSSDDDDAASASSTILTNCQA